MPQPKYQCKGGRFHARKLLTEAGLMSDCPGSQRWRFAWAHARAVAPDWGRLIFQPPGSGRRALSSLFSFIPWPLQRDPGPWGPFRGQLVLQLPDHNSPPLHVRPSQPARRQIAVVQWDSRGKSVKAFNSGEEDRWTKGKEKEGILGASSSLSTTHVTTSRSPSERSVMWRRFSLRDQKL